MTLESRPIIRSVRANALGPADNYDLVEWRLPPLGEEEVLVKMRAVSLGYADVLVSKGEYQIRPPVPFTPGSEGSGTVIATGSAVKDISPGDDVVVTRFSGLFADHVVAKPSELRPMPSGMSFEEGASYWANFATALHGLKDRGALQPGETLLVLGAAGGVGTAAVQIGKKLGATVIAGASTEIKRRFACEHGADLALDYTVEDWRNNLKAMTDGKGIDVVFDPVGGTLFEPAFRSLAWGGRHVVIGFAGGPVPRLPANLPLLKGAALLGAETRQFHEKEPQKARANAQQIKRWCSEGLRPAIGSVFEFSDFRAAMTAAAQGGTLGKVVIRVE